MQRMLNELSKSLVTVTKDRVPWLSVKTMYVRCRSNQYLDISTQYSTNETTNLSTDECEY